MIGGLQMSFSGHEHVQTWSWKQCWWAVFVKFLPQAPATCLPLSSLPTYCSIRKAPRSLAQGLRVISHPHHLQQTLWVTVVWKSR